MPVAWTADELYDYVPGGGPPPSHEDVVCMIDELYQEWVPGYVADIAALHIWACERFQTSLDQIDPQTLKKSVDRRIMQLKTLFNLVRDHAELRDDGLVKEKVGRIAKVMREARNSLESCAILCYQLDNTKEMQIPDAWNPDDYFRHVADDEKLNTFQKLLLAVLKKFAADGLRRLNDECYEEIKKDGESTHAWRRVKTIKEYIFDKIQKETDYEEWKCLTNPHDNCDRIVAHLMHSSQIEFPVLVMNRYMWAYNNGLYNVLTDMFFPFAACYIANLADVTAESVVRLACRKEAGEEDEVDTLDASNALAQNGVLVWNVHSNGALMPETCFRVGEAFYVNYCGRDQWPRLASEIQTFRRGLCFGNIADVRRSAVLELAPLQLSTRRPDDAIASLHDGVRVWNVLASGELTLESIFAVDDKYFSNKSGHEVWKTSDGAPYAVAPPTATDVAVKHFDVDFDFLITPETEATFDPRAIALPEMERIMEVQDLDPDSQEWLVLMLCRLFFPVGYDRWQVVLFIKGIAGSGKSTLAQIIRSFYPPTCITTLSSNIEAKFGLSAIYKGLVCVCAEVREDFGLDQAEWQSAVSGEEVQIAVKSKTAFSHKWDTPFFWLGNELPNYRNASGSVSRRIFMVEFRKKVHVSDPHLVAKFMKNIARFQRKGVSLYHAALRKHGERDIWSPGVLGTQLMEWFDRVKESSDQLYSFITNGRFIFAPTAYMPLDDFKKEYFEFRRSGGHATVKWNTEHYDAVFQERSLLVETETREYPPGSGSTATKKWISGINLRDEVDS